MINKSYYVAAVILAFAATPTSASTLTCNAPAQSICTEFSYSSSSETAGFQEHCQSTGSAVLQGAACDTAPSCTKAMQSGTVKTYVYNLSPADVESHCSEADGTFDAG